MRLPASPVLPRLHVVTDDSVTGRHGFAGTIQRMFERCGEDVAIHLRARQATAALLHELADRFMTVAARTGGRLFVNDRIDIAIAARAHGVQLGGASLDVQDARALIGDGAWIGRSVHTVEEADQAQRDGADYVVLGTIYESASHPDRPGAGATLVREVAERLAIPVIAIGGITLDRVADVAAAGAYGVAVIGGVWRSGDPVAAVGEYMDRVRSAWPESVLAGEGQGLMMTVMVNGEEREVAAGTTVGALLTTLGLHPRLVVVEHNREILDRTSFDSTEVREGDSFELVHFVGGG